MTTNITSVSCTLASSMGSIGKVIAYEAWTCQIWPRVCDGHISDTIRARHVPNTCWTRIWHVQLAVNLKRLCLTRGQRETSTSNSRSNAKHVTTRSVYFILFHIIPYEIF